jgi:riboflavin synthase
VHGDFDVFHDFSKLDYSFMGAVNKLIGLGMPLVDAIARVTSLVADARSRRLTISVPTALMRYIARKGSVTVDGVSLTVNDVGNDRFAVNLIPHTLAVTTLGALEAGAAVNLEVDQLARYVERLLSPAG